MENNYTTPLAKWARICEIIIPGYMFGKAWGIADDVTVDLFRAQFPAAAIDMAQWLKGVFPSGGEDLGRLIATSVGAVIGFIVIALLALLMHVVLKDRKYIDSLRFTSVTLIPIAVLNGTLSHVVKTIIESLGGGATAEALTKSALQGPQGTIYMCLVFYFISLWMFGKRTGVRGLRRWGVLGVGVVFVVVYFMAGLSITPAEWEVLLPKLQAAIASH